MNQNMVEAIGRILKELREDLQKDISSLQLNDADRTNQFAEGLDQVKRETQEALRLLNAELSDEFISLRGYLDKFPGDLEQTAKEYEGRIEALRSDVYTKFSNLSELVSPVATGLELQADLLDKVELTLRLAIEDLNAQIKELVELPKVSPEVVAELVDEVRLSLEKTQEELKTKLFSLEQNLPDLFEEKLSLVNQKTEHALEYSRTLEKELPGQVKGGLISYINDMQQLCQSELEQQLAASQKTLVDGMLNRWVGAASWAQGGPPYAKTAVVKHRRGLWQAQEETAEEPGVGGAWALLVDGVDRITNAGGKSAKVHYCSGRVDEIELPQWEPRFLKTWGEGQEYHKDDSVIYDRHRWIAVKDSPEGPPTKSDDWAVFALQGSRGRKGDPGPEGDIGPTVDTESLVEDVLRRLETKKEKPKNWWRGSWQYGHEYLAGEAVSFKRALWYCLRDNSGDATPGEPGGSTWELMLTSGEG